MERLDTLTYKRPHYSFHGGTFAANPITMSAGLATLELLENGRLIDGLNKTGERIRRQLGGIFEAVGTDVQITGAGSIFNVHFTRNKVNSARDAYAADREKLLDYDLSLISSGLFLLPTHNAVLSTVHSKGDVEKLLLETERYAKHRRNA